MAADPNVISQARGAAAAVDPCSLCGLPARHPLFLDQDAGTAARPFCCSGCRNVWQILSESGLLAPGVSPADLPLYRHALSMGLIARPDDPPADENRYGEEPASAEISASGSVEDVRDCLLSIDGMWCASCAWLIAETLKKRRGVISATVSFATDSARVVFKPARVGTEQLIESIRSLGYGAMDAASASPGDEDRVKARRWQAIKVSIAGIFAMNVMMLSPNIYASEGHSSSIFIHKVMPWSLLLLSIPVYVCSWPIFARAARAARHGAVIMETLVCIGSGVAMAYSLWCVLHGSDRSYFDTADMLLALVMIGKFIEANMRAGAVSAIELLGRAMPKKGTVLIKDASGGEQERTTTLAQIEPGDILRARAGEVIGADGIACGGSAGVDESLLTGESRPVAKAPGDPVTGGSAIVSGSLDIRVTRAADSGALRQIADLVQESLHRKTRSEEAADRISRIFVPLVVLLAAATFLGVERASGSVSDAIVRSVAVLVIACPCALGIATPMAIVAAVAAAARRGIVIADPGILEKGVQVTDLIFDKTGTLTEGRFQILQVYPAGADLLKIQQIEALSEHPIARAICAYGAGHISRQVANVGAESPVAENYERIDGCGVAGDIDGVRYFIGGPALAAQMGAPITEQMRSAAAQWQLRAATVVYYGSAGCVAGWIALGDRLRPGAPGLVDRLKGRGIAVEIVSGDSPVTVEAIARNLGIERWIGAAPPARKAQIVSERMADGRIVAMMGDGVNDAAALAGADVGVAIASGAEIAGRAAGATIMDNRVERMTEIIELGRRTRQIMRQNLFWALSYNLVCIPLAVFGWITPIWAAVAMLVSSLTVLVNTQRLSLSKEDFAVTQSEHA